MPAWSNTSTGGAAVQQSLDLHVECPLVRVQVAGAGVDDPDVVLLVDPDADRQAEHPVVRQRLGPERIDLEAWCLDHLPAPRPRALQQRLAGAQRRQQCDAHRADDQFASRGFHGFSSSGFMAL